MRTPSLKPFAAIAQAEILLNSKRMAPYAMILLFGGNALLWWGWGPASSRGWSTNSDFFLVNMFPVFSFMTVPLFNALIMGDPVIRDFRLRVDPLIFSKPVSRAEYLLGKFFGNFFVLVCCQAAFALTFLLLQAFHRPQMIVGPVRVLPYFKHFFFFVVISHLALAAIYFTVGTITRNAKIVYGLAVAFYPLYIAYQINLKSLPWRWRVALDPLLMNFQSDIARARSADFLNQLTVSYSADIIANRALMMLFAAVCLTILCARFSKTERSKSDGSQMSLLNLSTSAERIYNDAESLRQTLYLKPEAVATPKKVAIPAVNTISEGLGAHLKQFVAALGTEFRLLRAERSLVVILPLAVFLSTLEIAFYEVAPDVSYSAAFASNIAGTLLLFLFGITVFYTGEAMHRDREVRIEPVLWGVPAPNFVFLLSKFAAVFLISLSLILLVALLAIVLQIFKGKTPVELQAYLRIYSLILIPNIVFMISAAVALNVLLRDKYLAYVASLGIGGGLFYLFSQGHNHWLYNPVLYQLWTYSDLAGAGEGSRHTQILANRLYFLALSILCLALAHLFFERKSARGFWTNGRPNGAGRAILVAAASAAIAVATALAF